VDDVETADEEEEKEEFDGCGWCRERGEQWVLDESRQWLWWQRKNQMNGER
jgi:hypothetical protein